jgi:catechol 2,3-dioxygenase-like lactoylglutathione lyase family enzyme
MPLLPMNETFPLDGLISTPGIMVLLLVGYVGAMWYFLRTAPKVHTILVSDLEAARRFYGATLALTPAVVPLDYYAQTDPMLGSFGLYGNPALASREADSLWFQLRRRTQLHVAVGARLGARDRHVSFDREVLSLVLRRAEARGLRHRILQEQPLRFQVRDRDERVLEFEQLLP